MNATRFAVVVAQTKGAGKRFVVTAIRPILFQVGGGNDLAELLQILRALFDRKGKGAVLVSPSPPPTPSLKAHRVRGRFGGGEGHKITVIALLKCSSGRFGSCLAAIKGEAMIELAAFQRGLPIVKVAPQSLKKSLGCAPDQKWRDRAAELFNPRGQHQNWSKGAAGAVAVAFKVAGDGVASPVVGGAS